MAIDFAHEETDRIIASTEKRIRREYKKASEEVRKKLDDYLRRFEKKDAKWQEWVEQGVKTEKEYRDWRFGQMMGGRRWAALEEDLAIKYHEAGKSSSEIVMGAKARVYALNMNYTTYQIEKSVGFDTNFILYDPDTVENLFRKNPRLLPKPGKKVSKRIAEGKDVLWNKRQIQSVAFQSIVQGESIPKIAKRLTETVGDKDTKAAIRNARTLMTGAENAGREDGFKRAQDIGVRIKQQWVAILDQRTRHEHRELDGQVVEVGEPFVVDGEEILFPGDPSAPDHLVYNCRCGVRPVLQGHEIDTTAYRRDPDIGGMTYEEWKADRREKHNPIDLPIRKAEAIKASYIKEYREL